MRILTVIHDYLPRHAAGSQIYAHDLARAHQAAGHEVHVFTSESRPGEPPGAVLERVHEGVPITEVAQRREFVRLSDTFTCEEIEQRFSETLESFRPDVAHFHHLIHLSLRLPSLVPESIAQVFTLHDYWLSCPRGGQRLDWRGRICEQVDAAKCATCMANFFADVSVAGRLAERVEARLGGMPTGGRLAKAVRTGMRRAPRTVGLPAKHDETENLRDLQERRKLVGEVFERVDRFIAPSAFLAEQLRAYGLPGEKLEVSDYGFTPVPRPARRRQAGRKPFKAGYVGTLVPHKGVHVLLEAFAQLVDTPVSLEVFGDPRAFQSYSRQLRERARGLPVRFEGPFDPENKASVYRRFDFLVVPSIWWENSPLTIHEARLAGVPVIVPRLGGMIDLVEEGRSGLFYEPGSAASLAEQIRRYCNDREVRLRLRPDPDTVKTIDEDARWMQSLYEKLLGERR